MKFSLATIAYVFALLAAALAAFGGIGLVVGAVALAFWGTASNNPSKAVFWWMLGGLLVGALAVILLPAWSSARGPTLRNSCLNNLKQIGLALLNYEQAHGAFPPPYIADANGKPVHSWRVLILPYMEQQVLYKKYNFDEPWDGPNNRQLWSEMPDVYACPGAGAARRRGGLPAGGSQARSSDYVAVVDRSTIWNVDRPPSYGDVADGTSNTILVLEYSGAKLPWTAPVDLSLEEALAEMTATKPQGHVQVHEGYFVSQIQQSRYRLALFADAHGKALPARMDRRLARSLLTIAGGESIDLGDLNRYPSAQAARSWVRYKRVYAFGAFAALAVLPAVRLALNRSRAGARRAGDA